MNKNDFLNNDKYNCFCNNNHCSNFRFHHPFKCYEEKYNCCQVCPPGPAGPQGPIGATDPAETLLGFADFYAIMPPDNASTVAPGTDVSFPQDGPAYNSDISRISSSSFNLAEIGTYLIMF